MLINYIELETGMQLFILEMSNVFFDMILTVAS